MVDRELILMGMTPENICDHMARETKRETVDTDDEGECLDKGIGTTPRNS